jgi:hypothetical protein
MGNSPVVALSLLFIPAFAAVSSELLADAQVPSQKSSQKGESEK